MTIKEIAELLRAYTDEPDETFMSDNDVKAFLGQGYREFRDLVTKIEPQAYAIGASFTLTNTAFIDLATTNVTFADLSAGKILGGSATDGKRMGQILTVSSATAGTSPSQYIYQPVSSDVALQTAASGYMLSGTRLMFSGNITSPMAISYVPMPIRTLWNDLAAINVLDDFGMFHDVVALLAYKQYAIRDGAINDVLMAQLQARLSDLEQGVTHRNLEAPHYVQRVMGGIGTF